MANNGTNRKTCRCALSDQETERIKWLTAHNLERLGRRYTA